VKNSLFALLLTCAGLWAQDPPTTPAEPAATGSDTNAPAKPSTNLPPPAPAAAAPGDRVVPGAIPLPNFPRPIRPAAQLGATNATLPAAVPPTGAVPAAQLPPGAAAPGEQLVAINPQGPSTGAALEEMAPPGLINFPAMDLNQVLPVYAELVGRTVLRPTTLPAPTITLVSKLQLTRREAIAALDAVFALNGIATVNIGDKFVKVVPVGQAGQVGASFSKQPLDQLPDLGQFVTHVIQTTYVKPSDVVQALTPFASAGLANGILPIDPSQILVLRDYSENVKRMLEMIKKIDVSVPSEFISEVIPIKYALSSEIASALNSLSTGGGGTTVGGGGSSGGAPSTTTRSSGFGGSRGGMGGSSSGFGRQGMGMGMGNYQGGMGAQPFATATAGGAAGAGGTFTDRLRNIIQKVQSSGDIQVLGQTKIIADERTNSLLIFASREDMKMIKEIVAKLDVVLAQVLIEAVIIEVSLNKSADLAVSYLQKSPQGNYFRGIGAINNNNVINSSAFSPAIPGGSSSSTNTLLPQGFSYLANLGGDLAISLTALASSSRARILQRPRIQTSHAVPATLFVGESRPYPSGSYYGGASFGGYAQIQQLQIGVTLEVTPLINPDGLVVMDIHQKIDSFKGNVTIVGVGDVPVTSSKDASAKVAVRDHDTIMLGGLIETTKNDNNSGVPFLKDIPLLGYLFRSSAESGTRNELIVLIRPTVLPTPEVAALTARVEQNKLPEVNRIEAEVDKAEAKRIRDADKALNRGK
jgi:general secretion pathway protein D